MSTNPQESCLLNLHAVLPRTRVNGPGVRFGVWMQGCTLGCRGCFNPETHSTEPNEQVAVGDLVERIAAEADEIEGVTISGGEPLQQPRALLELVRGVGDSTDLSVVLFSGYELREIEGMSLGPDILDHVDVLIAGRYEVERRLARGLRGSANQTVHLLTDRYSMEEIEAVPEAEIEIDPSGNVMVSGIDPP